LKKVFKLIVENKKPERQLESVKNEIRKYMKRERKKKLPEETVYWEFNCRFGADAEAAQEVRASELTTKLDLAHSEKWEQCYVEILATAVKTVPKEEEVTEE